MIIAAERCVVNDKLEVCIVVASGHDKPELTTTLDKEVTACRTGTGVLMLNLDGLPGQLEDNNTRLGICWVVKEVVQQVETSVLIFNMLVELDSLLSILIVVAEATIVARSIVLQVFSRSYYGAIRVCYVGIVSTEWNVVNIGSSSTYIQRVRSPTIMTNVIPALALDGITTTTGSNCERCSIGSSISLDDTIVGSYRDSVSCSIKRV